MKSVIVEQVLMILHSGSGGAGGGEGVLFLRPQVLNRFLGPRIPMTKKLCKNKFLFPIFEYTLGVIHLIKKA